MQHERAWRTFLERLPASIDDDGAQFVLTAVDVLELDPATRQRPHGLAVQQYLQPVVWLKSGLDADTDVDVAGIVAQVLARLGARNGEAPIGDELRRVGTSALRADLLRVSGGVNIVASRSSTSSRRSPH